MAQWVPHISCHIIFFFLPLFLFFFSFSGWGCHRILPLPAAWSHAPSTPLPQLADPAAPAGRFGRQCCLLVDGAATCSWTNVELDHLGCSSPICPSSMTSGLQPVASAHTTHHLSSPNMDAPPKSGATRPTAMEDGGGATILALTELGPLLSLSSQDTMPRIAGLGCIHMGSKLRRRGGPGRGWGGGRTAMQDWSTVARRRARWQTGGIYRF